MVLSFQILLLLAPVINYNPFHKLCLVYLHLRIWLILIFDSAKISVIIDLISNWVAGF